MPLALHTPTVVVDDLSRYNLGHQKAAVRIGASAGREKRARMTGQSKISLALRDRRHAVCREEPCYSIAASFAS